MEMAMDSSILSKGRLLLLKGGGLGIRIRIGVDGELTCDLWMGLDIGHWVGR
jgi:hypothetical protein